MMDYETDIKAGTLRERTRILIEFGADLTRAVSIFHVNIAPGLMIKGVKRGVLGTLFDCGIYLC